MDKIKELYAYRQMLISLVKKDLRGRYKASVLGFLWTFINPLLQLLVYTVVFSVVMRAGIEKFYIFVFVALVPWIFFSSSLTGGASIIVMNQDMIQKIYFPRIVLPISYVTSCFVNMLFSFIVIFAVLLVPVWLNFYGMPVFTFDYGHRVYFCIGTGTDHFGMHGVSEGSRAYTWYCVYGMDVYVAGGISAFLHSEEAAVDFPVKSDGTDHYSVS